MKRLLFLITALALGLSADRLSGAGASFPAPAYFDWAFDYQRQTGHQVNYQSIGSGGGIKQVRDRMVHFGATDAPLTPKQTAKMKLLQFPALIGTIVAAYHVPGVEDGRLRLKNGVLADIFMGKITFWDDAAIKTDNPKLALPHEKITVVRRADGSGTTYNFTYFLSRVSPAWDKQIGTGKSVSWPVGVGGKGNEGVSSLIKQTPYSIGYVEYAYKVKNRFGAVVLQSMEGHWVEANEVNAQAAAKFAKWHAENDFHQLLALQPGANSYPIVAATFILLPAEKVKTDKKVVKFFDWAFKNGDASAKRLGYIPLPANVKAMIRDYWKAHKL